MQVRDDALAQAARLPQGEWDIPALAASLDYEPARAFAFVRDSIGFDPYPGVLRGAEGTLAARAGSAYDRALLLGALLDEMEVPHRFAFADLDETTAAALLQRASLPPASPLPAPGIELATTLDPAAIAGRAGRDYARLRLALGDRLDAVPGDAAAEQMGAVRHHAWVQVAYGTGWRDLDPSLPDAIEGTALAVAASTGAEIPPDARQSITLRIYAESIDGGVLSEALVMERRFDAADASAHEIFLYFQPAVEGIGGAILEALSGDVSWMPVLMIDGTTDKGTPFRAGGRGTDVFGNSTAPPELARLRLEVEHAGPGRVPVSGERILLDRVPDGLRGAPAITVEQLLPMGEDDAGPYVMAQIHHIMVSTGGADRRDYALQRAWSADFTGFALEGEDYQDAYALSDVLWPMAAADQELVVASEAAIVPALGTDGTFRPFVDAPRVFITTVGRDATSGDALGFATDLLIDGVGLLPGGPAPAGEAARRRLWYGALETALETELALKHATLLEPGDRTISGASLGAQGKLTLLTPPDAAGLPPDSPPALRRALAGGSFVLVAGDPAVATAWWTVDPSDGAARSVLDPGLGGVRKAGSVSSSLRTADTSYTHGSGGRLPPRTPMIRPPAGGGGTPAVAARGTPCIAGDSTGYIALTSCISIPVSLARFLLFAEVALLALFAAYMLA